MGDSINIQDLRKNNNNPVHVTSRSPRPSQTFARECMCGLETRRSIGGRRGQRFLRYLGEEMGWWWGGRQRLLNECTSGAEKRLRGQGRFQEQLLEGLCFAITPEIVL